MFDPALEALLERRGEHGRDLQSQAHTHDPAHHVGMIVATLKTRVIVELGMAGEAVALPMSLQNLGDKGGVGVGRRPGPEDRPVQSTPGEDLAKAKSFQRQILNDIKAVELGAALAHGRQTPTRRGCHARDARLGVEQPLPGPNLKGFSFIGMM